LQFVKSRNVRVPKYLLWKVAEHENLAPEGCGLATADATYFRTDQLIANAGLSIVWSTLENHGKVPVWIRAEVLESDEHTLFVFSHEVYEIKELKKTFRANGGRLTLRRLNALISPDSNGAIHNNAVRYADSLVGILRREQGDDHGY
jgi:hypothetical protein